MNIEYTFIAIMFPAIPLTMVMFGNRFHTVSVLIRKIHDDYIYSNSIPAEFTKQLKILKSRLFQITGRLFQNLLSDFKNIKISKSCVVKREQLSEHSTCHLESVEFKPDSF